MREPTLKEKLLLISEVMSDAGTFVQVQVLMEEFQKLADEGDPRAQEFLTTVLEKFYRLCNMAIKG